MTVRKRVNKRRAGDLSDVIPLFLGPSPGHDPFNGDEDARRDAYLALRDDPEAFRDLENGHAAGHYDPDPRVRRPYWQSRLEQAEMVEAWGDGSNTTAADARAQLAGIDAEIAEGQL